MCVIAMKLINREESDCDNSHTFDESSTDKKISGIGKKGNLICLF